MFGAVHFIYCINSSIATTGGRKPLTLRLLVRRLHDIAIQEDITCCHHQLWIKISLVANSVCNKPTKDKKSLKSTAILVTPTAKANRR